MIDSGSWYVREEWPHDGNPIESEHFVVYSDAASPEARRKVAEIAEEAWSELLDEFSIERGMLDYPENPDRLDIYAYRGRDPQDWAARAYYGGLIVWSPDHPSHRERSFVPVLQHELVHVLQWLITGPVERAVDVWFIEGLPEFVSGGSAGGAIRGMDELDELTARHGRISPISYKTYAQITDPETGEHFNYPMFQLAVEYLMDKVGYGRSLEDARDVLIDVAEGSSFEVAFEDHMAVRLDQFEREFFERMESHLPQYRNRLFSPAGFTLASVSVVALVIAAPVIGYRRWQPISSAAPIADLPRSRIARGGFVGGLVVASLIATAYFLAVMFALGTANGLNNEAYSEVRFRAYWVLVAYLLASVGLVVWSVHRWLQRAWSAYLVAPLVIVATLATTLLVAGML